MRRPSAKRALTRHLQPAELLKRYHRRTRRRVPWLQTLALLVLLPLLSFVSRVRVTGRENIPNGGYIAAANHPSIADALFVVLRSAVASGSWPRASCSAAGGARC